MNWPCKECLVFPMCKQRVSTKFYLFFELRKCNIFKEFMDDKKPDLKEKDEMLNLFGRWSYDHRTDTAIRK